MMRPWIFLAIVFASLAAAALAAAPVTAHAHGDEEEASGLEGYEVSVSPQEAREGDEVLLEARILREELPLRDATVTLVVDRHEEGISDRLETAEREPGSYVAKYRFRTAGAYEVHVEFVDFGETKRATRYVNALRKNWLTPGRLFGVAAFGLAALALAIGLLRKRVKAGIVGAIAVLIAGGLGYSLYVTLQSGAASRGVVTCVSGNECYLTAHIHAYVSMTVCGEEATFPIERGALTGPHTHEERNIIHWHDRLPYDTAAKKLLNTQPFTLDAFFNAMETAFPQGNECPDGNPAALKMFVNGMPNEELERYVWHDRDVIVLIFDSRTPEEVAAWLLENPIPFPALGRG